MLIYKVIRQKSNKIIKINYYNYYYIQYRWIRKEGTLILYNGKIFLRKNKSQKDIKLNISKIYPIYLS